jgi:hypothetical protein
MTDPILGLAQKLMQDQLEVKIKVKIMQTQQEIDKATLDMVDKATNLGRHVDLKA